nr:PREDICTED: protein FAM3B isoform X1 [Lepisosteus oculatus]
METGMSVFLKNVSLLRGLALAVCCVLAWYLGQVLSVVMPPQAISLAVSGIHRMAVDVPRVTAPAPRRQKCSLWSACPPGSFAFQVASGGGIQKFPKICFEDEIITGKGKDGTGRGMNIVAIDAASGKRIASRHFDMWVGENSGAMVKFIQEIPTGSFILMATFDEGSTKLTEEAKKEIEKLGSTEIRNIGFRSSWVFVGAKGFSLPANMKKEKMNHSDKSKNRYAGWPAEVQLQGCVAQQRRL